jgi:alcohol dehydrogenase class IV
MTAFEFAAPHRILFGRGRAAELPELAASLGSRVALVTGASRRYADRVPAVCIFPVAAEPTFDDVRAIADAARAARVDAVVAIGGGSALDAGKALAMLLTNGGDPLDYAEVIGAGKSVSVPSAPFIAVPTTAGTGSEATRNSVLRSSKHGAKVSLRSPLMLPRVALVDPNLTLDLPPGPTAAGGMDALSQLIEPFLSTRANPFVDALCRDGIPRIARALPRAMMDGSDADAREELALAALYSGIALANAGLGAVHGLAAAIGGEFAAPHGAVCAALLPGVFEANFFHSMEISEKNFPSNGKFAEVARLLTGRADATPRAGAAWLRELRRQLGIPGLAAYGIRAEHAPALAQKAQRASSMKSNPVPLADETLARVVIEAL